MTQNRETLKNEFYSGSKRWQQPLLKNKTNKKIQTIMRRLIKNYYQKACTGKDPLGVLFIMTFNLLVKDEKISAFA